MSEWTGKVCIALIVAVAVMFIFSAATKVGIERTQTCRAQPQLCDTHIAPRAEVVE